MPFICIHGTFHLLNKTAAGKVTGFEPDGDSVHFKAGNEGLLRALPILARPISFSQISSTMLRLEAIDALELHFGATRQPALHAEAAREALTVFLGLGEVKYAPPRGLRVISATGDGANGWILSRGLEVNGRPVSFAFAGNPPFADGERVTLSPALLRRSLNFHLLARGLAYPLFYDGLFFDLRRACQSAVRGARNRGLGLWPADSSLLGVAASDAPALAQNGVIFPKLFRRLNEFWGEGHTGISDFPAWLEATSERVLDLKRVHFTHFDDVVRVEAGVVRMTQSPEELVFISAK